MNDRIRELAKQAGFNPYNYEGANAALFEKFAELIIKGCIKQGDVLAKHYIDMHSEQEQTLLLASIADYSNAIRVHFGVE